MEGILEAKASDSNIHKDPANDSQNPYSISFSECRNSYVCIPPPPQKREKDLIFINT